MTRVLTEWPTLMKWASRVALTDFVCVTAESSLVEVSTEPAMLSDARRTVSES